MLEVRVKHFFKKKSLRNHDSESNILIEKIIMFGFGCTWIASDIPAVPLVIRGRSLCTPTIAWWFICSQFFADAIRATLLWPPRILPSMPAPPVRVFLLPVLPILPLPMWNNPRPCSVIMAGHPQPQRVDRSLPHMRLTLSLSRKNVSGNQRRMDIQNRMFNRIPSSTCFFKW